MKIILIFILLLSACENDTTGSKLSKEEPYPHMLWQQVIDHKTNSVGSTEPLFIATDSAFLFAYDSSIVKVNTYTGKEKWKTKVNDRFYSVSTGYFLVDESKNQLFFKDFDRSYGVLNYQTGQIIHKVITDLAEGSRYPVQTDKHYIFSGYRGMLYLIDKDNFSRQEKFVSSNASMNSFVYDSLLYVGVSGKNIHDPISSWGGIFALDPISCDTLWTYRIPSKKNSNNYYDITGFSKQIIVTDKYVYGGGRTGWLVCLDKRTGEEIWAIKKSSEIEGIAISGDVFFGVQSNSVNLLGINRFTGKELWRRDLEFSASDGPKAYKGNFYWFNLDRDIEVIDPITGNTLHIYDLPGAIDDDYVTFGDDKIFIAAYDRILAAKAFNAF